MTYYEILGVRKSASQEEIKEAYKKLIKKYHPDIYQGNKIFAEKKTKDLNLAYDVLSDPSSRAAYDEEIAPTPKYQYTPPRYTTSTYYTRSTSTNANTTSSTYTKINEMHNKFSDDVVKKISSLKTTQRILLFFLILLIYFILLLLTFNQFNKIESDEYTGTILGPQKIESTGNENTTDSDYYNSRKNFHIEDYFDDDELYEYYKNSEYKSEYSFDEYKNIMENYMYQLWYGY